MFLLATLFMPLDNNNFFYKKCGYEGKKPDYHDYSERFAIEFFIRYCSSYDSLLEKQLKKTSKDDIYFAVQNIINHCDPSDCHIDVDFTKILKYNFVFDIDVSRFLDNWNDMNKFLYKNQKQNTLPGFIEYDTFICESNEKPDNYFVGINLEYGGKIYLVQTNIDQDCLEKTRNLYTEAIAYLENI